MPSTPAVTRGELREEIVESVLEGRLDDARLAALELTALGDPNERNEREEFLESVTQDGWDDDDERWWRLSCAYCLLNSSQDGRWADQPRFRESANAALELVELMVGAFDVDRAQQGNQFIDHARCTRAAATISRNLKFLIEHQVRTA